MTRTIIRAVKERSQFVGYLKRRLPHAEFCFDENQNAMDTFYKSLRMAGNDPVIHMEDDIILTKNFVEKIESAISKRPDWVSQFFSMRKKDIEIGSRYDNNFIMGQCFYLPAGYSKKILGYTWEKLKEHPTGLDMMIGDFLKDIKKKYWIHVPSLVEHRICKSLINSRRSSKRQSKTFEDPWL